MSGKKQKLPVKSQSKKPELSDVAAASPLLYHLSKKDILELRKTSKDNRDFFTKKLVIEKIINEYENEQNVLINELNETIDDGNVHTLEELLIYEPEDLLELLYHSDLVEINNKINKLRKRDIGSKKYKKRKKTRKKKKRSKGNKKTKHK